MKREEAYSLALVTSRKRGTHYLEGCIAGFEAGESKLSRILYKHKIRDEPPLIRACRTIISERRQFEIEHNPS